MNIKSLTTRCLFIIIGSNTNCLFAKDLMMDISASVDIVGGFSTDKSSENKDRIDVREAEVLFASPIDPYFDGTLSLAAHRESGVSLFEIHEAFISSSKIIPRSRFKVGQFFLGIGKLNQTHRHEWPFIEAPKVQKEFFGEEAASDTGGEYSLLFPTPFFLEMSVGVTNGLVFGHSHNEGEKPSRPLFYNRIAIFHDFFLQGGALWGINYLNHLDSSKTKNIFSGIDLTAKWKEGKKLNFLFQGEIWNKTSRSISGIIEKKLGAYILPQFILSENLYFGCRLDYFNHLNLRDVDEREINNHEIGIVPTITLQPSEFSKFRVAFEHTQLQIEERTENKNNKLLFQANFILGAHPAHDF